jgi:hypothetical protein
MLPGKKWVISVHAIILVFLGWHEKRVDFERRATEEAQEFTPEQPEIGGQ